MKSSKQSVEHPPFIKWYPTDWRADPRLRMCSLAARGLWIDLIGYMHEGEPYGHLTINGVSPSMDDVAALVGRPRSEVQRAWLELEQRQVFSREGDAIYSRRMVRDKAKAERDRHNGKGGGNPKLLPPVIGGVNPPDKAHIPEARSQKPESSEADASGAEAPINHRKRLFDEGLPKLARLTGKGPDACRSFVAKCLKAAGDDAVVVLGLIEDAERNQAVDPSGYIVARLKGAQNGPHSGSKIIQAADDLRRKIASFDGPARGDLELRSGPGEAPARLLSNR